MQASDLYGIPADLLEATSADVPDMNPAKIGIAVPKGFDSDKSYQVLTVHATSSDKKSHQL